MIDSIKPKQEENPLREDEKEIDCMAEEESIIKEKGNILPQKFIDTLLEGVPSSKRTEKELKQKNNKRNTHNKRKRYQYAKHQELYKKSPRKLLDLALMGDHNKSVTVNLPEADSVHPLYEKL